MPRIIQHDPMRFPKNKEMRDKYITLGEKLGEYGEDFILRHIAWKLFSTQEVSIEDFCAEFTAAMEEYRTKALSAVKNENPEHAELRAMNENTLTVTELGYFLRLVHDPSFCCIYHAVLAFAEMRPYIPVKAQNVQGDDLLSMLSAVFGGEPQEIAPGITAMIINLDKPNNDPDAAFEEFLETGRVQAPGNETDH